MRRVPPTALAAAKAARSFQGNPAMNTITRNDAMITTAIPKSGSFRITATNSPITASIGRNARYPCFGFSPFRSMVDARQAHGERDPDRQEQDLALEEVRGVEPVSGRRTRHDVRRAVDHDHAENRERKGAQREDQVLVALSE